jgi:hypothetical protein
MFASDGQAVVELGCWAHARRKFFDLQVNGIHHSATEALRRIGTLYAVEEAARAIDYTLNRWPSLVRYAHTGNLPIDNNPVENAIRPIALGKKNWLFAGSERAGKRAAAIQSLFATAKLNGIEPAAWLKDTLEKLPAWSMRRIDELLPIKSTAQITSA